MSTAPMLDTHIWIWWMSDSTDLSSAEREALNSLDPENRPIISGISL